MHPCLLLKSKVILPVFNFRSLANYIMDCFICVIQFVQDYEVHNQTGDTYYGKNYKGW